MKTYKKFLIFLDTTLIGILVGVIVSVVINILTSMALDTEIIIIILLHVVSIICLIGLLRIRQEYDEAFSKQKAGTPVSTKIANSVDEKKKISFISYVFISFITFLAGMVIVVRKIERKESEAAKCDECNHCKIHPAQKDSLLKEITAVIRDVKDSSKTCIDTAGKK